MGRKRAGFTKEEIGFVRSYIEKKLVAKDWPSHETHRKALADYIRRPTAGRYANDDLARWCNKWLDPTQWHKLRNTMASWRFRQKTTDLPKRVNLSPKAWKIISTLAEIENKSVSSFITNRLEAEYKRHSIVNN